MCFALLLGSLILGYCGKVSIGQLTLSPMSVAPVCRAGDPLQLTCTASVEFIRWIILVTNEQGMEEEIIVSRNSRDSSPPPSERIINSTKFTFTRVSGENDLPLITTLAINSTGIGLNGTVVRCRDASNPETVISTTIRIISNNLYTPRLNIVSEIFSVDNITVTVEWTQTTGALYTTRIIPQAASLSTGSNSLRLTLSYNTGYNFSVVAATACNPAATAFIELNYAKCEDPNLVLQLNNDSALEIEGYDDLIHGPVEGSTIRFSCPPGLELTGPDSATCTEYGEWEPDPSGLMCNVSESYSSTLEGTTVRIWCTGMPSAIHNNNGIWELVFDSQESCSVLSASGSEGLSRDGKIAVASSVTVFAVASILFFVVGFLCGHFYQKKRKSSTTAAAGETVPPGGSGGQTQTPYYDNVVIQQSDQELELKDNVAYGPIRSTIST